MQIETSMLSGLLSNLDPAVLKSDEIPILKTILISKESLVAYNMSVGCFISTDSFPFENPICISFTKLKAFVIGAPADQIDIQIENDVLILKSGKSTAKLPIELADDFPNFQDLIKKVTTENLSTNDDLVEGLKACLPFTAKTGSRQSLQGVCILKNKIQATDSIRIGQYLLENEVSDVPKVLPAELCKAVKGADFLYFDNERVAILKDNVIYFSGLIVGDFPDVEKYLPEVKKYIKLPKEEMRKALKKVGDFSEDGLQNAKCKLSFENGIEIRYEGNVAQVKEFFDFGGKLPAETFILNPYHFEKMLQYCDRFAFVKKEAFDLLYGISDNNKFKCLLSLEQE